MIIRLFEVNRDCLLTPLPVEPPQASWRDDERVRWLHIEEASDPLLNKLVAPLGVDIDLLQRYTDPVGSAGFVARNHVVAFTHPLSLELTEPEHHIHVACVRNVLVSFQNIARDFDDWHDRWLRGWPLGSPTVAGLVQRIMESMGHQDTATYLDIRKKTGQLGNQLKREGADFDSDLLEMYMAAVHRIGTFFFDQRLIYAAIRGTRSEAFIIGDEKERFKLAASAAASISDGASQLQRRLENLQQQHSLEVASITDRNLRVLTVLSAVFLPLTVISGIYGMNFEHMPELDEDHAYWIVLFLMGTILFGGMGFFYVKGWFK